MRFLNLTSFKQADKIQKIYNNDHVDKILDDFLIKKGLSYLQHGGYSAAYTDGQVVYKIFSDDPVYDDYLNLISRIPEKYKKFAPTIYKNQIFDKNKNIHIVIMEKLQDWPEKYQVEKPWNILNQIINNNDLESIKKYAYYYRLLNNIVDILGSEFLNYILWVKKQLDLEEIDFHYVNIMWRDNVPVLIDP